MDASSQSGELYRLMRKARSIELQAGRASPTLAAQLRALAASYQAEAATLARNACPPAPERPHA